MDAATNTDIVSVSVDPNTADQFGYAPVTTVLAANHSYYLLSQETFGGDQWYDAGGFISSSAGTINGPAYQQANGAYVLLYTGIASYGPVNLQFGF